MDFLRRESGLFANFSADSRIGCSKFSASKPLLVAAEGSRRGGNGDPLAVNMLELRYEKQTMGIIKPSFISLDSSHLNTLSDHLSSSKAVERKQATDFGNLLQEKGFVLVLSIHHILEMIAIEDEEKAKQRLAFLRSRPLVGWIAPANESAALGSVVDIMAAEAWAALTIEKSDANSIRDHVAPNLFKVGTGEEAVAPYVEQWRLLQLGAQEQAKKSQVIASIAPTKVGLNGNLTVFDLLNGKLRSPTELIKKKNEMKASLSNEIAVRGDRRIKNAFGAAEYFYDGVFNMTLPHPTNNLNFVSKVLADIYISLDELNQKTTTEEIGYLGEFRKKLMCASEASKFNFKYRIKDIKQYQIPSWIVQDSLRVHGQDLLERKGSDITDRYLACLAPYAAITFVDKRTKQNFSQAAKKSCEFAKLIRRVEKASNYVKIGELLAEYVQPYRSWTFRKPHRSEGPCKARRLT